jgi:beta-glucanase (GH16 family)
VHGRRSDFKWLLGLSLVLVLAVSGVAFALPRSGHGATRWKEIWSDQFNGLAGSPVNTNNWEYQVGQGLFGNGEVEVMTNSTSNVHLDGHGHLDITALYQGSQWTSGRIKSMQAFTPQPGGELRVVASLRLPTAAEGLGYWPAFWMLGLGTWPAHGEIDIMEDVNSLSQHSGALHCGNLSQPNSDGTYGPCHETTGISSRLRPCPDCLARYHTYSVIVDRRHAGKEQIRWYLDNSEFFHVNEQQVGAAAWNLAIHHGFNIIFDLAMGGSFPNIQCACTTPTSTTASGGTLQVASVAVYQN